MNQAPSDFEIEERLRRLRPLDPSQTFLQAVSEQVGHARSPAGNRLPVRVAMAAASIAVCLVIAVAWHTPEDQRLLQRRSPRAGVIDWKRLERLPTVLVYRMSVAVSSQDLDRLLDEHARVLLPPIDSEPAQKPPVLERALIP